MTAGDVNIQIKSIDKLSGTDIDTDAFMTSIEVASGDSVTTTVVPRTSSTGTVTYDVIVTVVEIS